MTHFTLAVALRNSMFVCSSCCTVCQWDRCVLSRPAGNPYLAEGVGVMCVCVFWWVSSAVSVVRLGSALFLHGTYLHGTDWHESDLQIHLCVIEVMETERQNDLRSSKVSTLILDVLCATIRLCLGIEHVTVDSVQCVRLPAYVRVDTCPAFSGGQSTPVARRDYDSDLT